MSTLFESELPAWARHLAVFDLETTGLDLREARIVTACAVELDAAGQVIGENQEWLADPGIEIPLAAAQVHGVTTELARAKGRPAKEVVAEVVSKLQSFFDREIPVVAYNAPYDFTILHFEALRHGITPLSNPGPIIDPLVIDKFVDQYRPGKRTLEATSQFYSVALNSAHNATADAIAAGQLAQAIALKFSAQLPSTAAELHQAQIDWCHKQDSSYENFRRRSIPDFVVQRGWPVKN